MSNIIQFQQIDNSKDYPLHNPFLSTSIAPSIKYSDGNREITTALYFDTFGRIIIPVGMFSSPNTDYDVTISAGAETHKYTFHVTNVKSTSGSTSGGCANSCNSCGSCSPCGCKHKEPNIDITPFLTELQNMRTEIQCVYETYENVNQFIDLTEKLQGSMTQYNIDNTTIVNKNRDLEALVKAISTKLNELIEGESKEALDRITHLHNFERLSKTVGKLELEYADILKLKNDVASLMTLEKDVKTLTEKLNKHLLEMAKYDFDKMYLDGVSVRQDFDKFVLSLSNYDFSKISGAEARVMKEIKSVEDCIDGLDLSGIRENRKLLEALDQYDFDQISRNKQAISKLVSSLDDIDKMKDFFEELYKIRFKLSQIEDLIAKVEQLTRDVDTLGTRVKSAENNVRQALNGVNEAKSKSAEALSKAESAIISHKELEDLVKSYDAIIEELQCDVKTNTGNITKLFDANKKLVRTISSQNNQIDALKKDVNALKRSLEKILGSQTSCPTPSASNQAGTPCN